MSEKIFTKYRIRLFHSEQIEPEEIFFDSSKIKEFAEEELEVGKFETPIASLNFRIFSVLQAAALLSIGAITAFMGIALRKDYAEQAHANTQRTIPISAPRGLIESSDGEILARNEISFDLIFYPALFSAQDEFLPEKIAHEIGTALAVDPGNISERMSDARVKHFSETTLIKGIQKANVNKIESAVANSAFFELKQVYQRMYAGGDSFSHIIGYTGEVTSGELGSGEYFPGERIGKAGIEAFYDQILHGKGGILLRQINSRGEIVSQNVEREPYPGENMRLTISASLERRVYEILQHHARSLRITSAAAVLQNPRSGAILALVSLPSFDANLFTSGASDDLVRLLSDPNEPLFNRAIAGEYPSGSTIKPIIAAAALEEGLVTQDFLVYSGGSISVPSVYNSEIYYEFKDWKAHGWSDLRKAISDSVNIYFYTIGGGYNGLEGLGIKRIEDYLLKFGWGGILGIDIPGERGGLIPAPKWKKEFKGENWYIGDTYLTSIGQGDILVTPLQVASAMAVFANGGTLFAPHLAAKQNSEGTILRRNFVQSEHIEIVREGLRRAVTSGSAQFLSNLPFSSAGKTGTAQIAGKKNHAWFAGFAPYENPEVVVVVLLEEGENSNYAVRAARDILGAYFEIYYPQYAED